MALSITENEMSAAFFLLVMVDGFHVLFAYTSLTGISSMLDCTTGRKHLKGNCTVNFAFSAIYSPVWKVFVTTETLCEWFWINFLGIKAKEVDVT